ncbi:MAG: LOG family protein [Proteobacteria bacterium]|nr:LOG family protein [Pseudomonadota bacterium]MBS0465429.1 LOG family protein [Pseudomonadota bacterium]
MESPVVPDTNIPASSTDALRCAGTVDALVSPRGGLDVLSRAEVARLRDAAAGSVLHDLLRRCALAVLTTGSTLDDARAAAALYPDFDIHIRPHDRGIKLELRGAPAQAFVDGQVIRGVAELLFAVVRDIIYVTTEIEGDPKYSFASGGGITSAVFEILRNAHILKPRSEPNLVVCWGGHSISREEYDYTKTVGYELGLRGLDICTGCGPGAMKGPMKGATIAHAKQRKSDPRYIGLTEPGIIAAESPNPIVNHLVILPDIEKRLEAFVRLGHGFIVFPGGVGTCEEILFILGLLTWPENAAEPFPLVFTGPRESAAYFERIDHFLRLVLGEDIAKRYQILVDDPAGVARAMKAGIGKVRQRRIQTQDAYFFNWSLAVPDDLQHPFEPSHAAMAALNLHRGQPIHQLAANLRRAFSGIVAGNVKEEGMKCIEREGPFEIHGDADIMQALDELLKAFVAQGRMKMSGEYKPCYRVVV